MTCGIRWHTRKLRRPLPAGKLFQVILVGQTELEAKLDFPELQPFKEVIATRRGIPPLNPEECAEYIDHRLKVVGSSSAKNFTPEAIDRISRFSGGIPRIINILWDNALMIGSTIRPKIDERIAARTIQQMDHLQARPPGEPEDSPPSGVFSIVKNDCESGSGPPIQPSKFSSETDQRSECGTVLFDPCFLWAGSAPFPRLGPEVASPSGLG